MHFKYLSIEVSGYEDVEAEVKRQPTKATRIVACLNNNTMKYNINISEFQDLQIYN